MLNILGSKTVLNYDILNVYYYFSFVNYYGASTNHEKNHDVFAHQKIVIFFIKDDFHSF